MSSSRVRLVIFALGLWASGCPVESTAVLDDAGIDVEGFFDPSLDGGPEGAVEGGREGGAEGRREGRDDEGAREGGDEGSAPEGSVLEGSGEMHPDWTCAVRDWEDTTCDCGCGAPDPSCDDGGCSDVDCYVAGCEWCNDGDSVSPCEQAPSDWTCDAELTTDPWCDCGCGDIDPACNFGGCTELGCQDPACDRCADGTGTTWAHECL